MSIHSFVTVCANLLIAGVAAAQSFPTKPIRVVTGSAGGANDFALRVIAPGMSAALGQSVIVDNRGNVTGELVAKAPPDGYTLLMEGSSFWLGPLVEKMPYDPVNQFAPITLSVLYPNVVVVNPSLPVNSIKDLIALARAKPGALNYGTGGFGSSTHLGVELFNSMAGVRITRIDYKGSGPALIGLMGGEVQMMVATAGAAIPHVKSGKLRALAVTTSKPSPLVPGLATVSASGLPGYESLAMSVIFAPAKTPNSVIARLNRDIVAVLSTQEVKDRYISGGVEALTSTPDEASATVKADIAKWSKVMKEGGIKLN